VIVYQVWSVVSWSRANLKSDYSDILGCDTVWSGGYISEYCLATAASTSDLVNLNPVPAEDELVA
jgi:hypothetical protein